MAHEQRSSLLLRALMEKGMDGEVSVELAAMIKSVGSVNCFQVEKFQLLTGQATEIVEQRNGAGREEFDRWLKESALAVPAQVDSESTGGGAITGGLVADLPAVTAAPRQDVGDQDEVTGAAAGMEQAGGGSDGGGVGCTPTVSEGSKIL